MNKLIKKILLLILKIYGVYIFIYYLTTFIAKI